MPIVSRITISSGKVGKRRHAADLTNRPVKGGAWAVSKAAVINASGQLDGAAGTATDCVLVNGTSAAKANAAHTHACSGANVGGSGGALEMIRAGGRDRDDSECRR